MKIHAIVHKAEEGGYWAEVPSIPGCATQGETMEDLRSNLREAIEGCLSVPVGLQSSPNQLTDFNSYTHNHLRTVFKISEET
jgi:predicted RNase H-like HicB family nuclease